ncbi:cell surface glycoprotein CD200 receptor 1-A-like isoform X3 [Anser cygnoides]|uniref:cell surface glycoprotein CD200 receptor 1-A-like isoform X3 n=1 Tax=Anser cygnoides TaxID=8845 RepID=UPI0034D296E6
MKKGADMKIAGKAACIFMLLTITKLTRITGNRMAAQVGHSAVMTCPNKTDATMVTWKISPKIGGPCTLGYRADQKKVDRTNCSDSMNCEFRSSQSYALEIQQVGMADEGNYSCEVVTQEGNFHQMYQLTVLVPPRLSLYCDDHRNPVCKAAAGRPAAEISWVPENNSMTETDSHDNGTVTVLSRFTAHSTDEKTVTCMVYHTTLNETKSIACSSYSVTKLNLPILLLHIPYRMTQRRWNLILLTCRRKTQFTTQCQI